MTAQDLETPEAAINASNTIFEFLSNVPVGIWEVVTLAAIGAVGWFGKTGFDVWQKSRAPFKQDRERYQAVVDAIDPAHLHYFKEIPLSAIESIAVDGVDDGYELLSSIRKREPDYLHKKLRPLEDDLFIAIEELCNFLPIKLFPVRANSNVYTMYWDQFDEWSDEHNQRFQLLRNELMQKIDRSIHAYEAYRDAGNRLFADRLVRGKVDG
ncbi:hypothetical protein [Celeribacter sp.]|uniref:hypothetical protein n=1 Tax=Celeribacter sp. TaxID=1890673 RepID=UPI003A8C934C